jgi:hypothetical protein
MLDTAQTLFGELTEQTIRIGRGPARVKALSRAVATNRSTYFGRSY